MYKTVNNLIDVNQPEECLQLINSATTGHPFRFTQLQTLTHTNTHFTLMLSESGTACQLI